MNGISASMAEQKSGAEQINVSISEVNIGAQNNASISEKLSESVVELTTSAQKLAELLNADDQENMNKEHVLSQAVKKAG